MRRGLRIALGAGIALAALLAALAVAFLWGVAIPGEFLRAPLERALTAAFGVPTRIEGPLRVRTGLAATATADALVLADPSGGALARGVRPGVRIGLAALLRRVIALDEVTGERLELNLARTADGRANWAPLLASAPGAGPPAVSFGGIARLRVGTVAVRYRAGDAAPAEFAIAELDGALPLRDPTTARGTAQVAGQAIAFDLRTASLEGLQASAAGFPLKGSIEWSGARLQLDGKVAPDGSRLDAAADVTAADADPPLAALGVAARGAGRLEARAQVGLTATAAEASALALTLGTIAFSGSARVAWGGPRLSAAVELAGERVDLEPFLSAPSVARDKVAAEVFIEALERAATSADATVALKVGELAGTPVSLHELALEGRSADRVIAVRGAGVIAGTRAKATLDYDARKPQRTLAGQIEGGAASTAALAPGQRPQAVSGTTGSIRGQLRGQGATARAMVASLEASLEARDLRWRLAGRGGEPLNGRFDTVRIAMQGTRASSAEVSGRLGDARCTLKVSGGALAPLVGRRPWPLQLAGTCPGGRLTAKGRIELAERHLAADLAFDASADRIGPIAQALGVAPTAPHPFAARGTLALDEQRAHARLDALRLGRTNGAGEVEFPLARDGVPRVRLALANANLDELAALGDAAPAPSDPLAREIFDPNLRLPDVDFEVTAERVQVAGADLRRLSAGGAVRARRLPPTRFSFEWRGAPVSGEFGVDFAAATPRAQLDATARNADLGALLMQLGQKGVGLRAGELSLRVRAAGVRLGELLAAASVDAAIERGALELAQRPVPGLERRAEFAATLNAAPGRPAAAVARGTIGGEPFDLALDTPSLAGLARGGAALPVTLRASLGDARLQAAGTIARDGTGDGRLELAGGRLDRLGKLAGMDLPAIGPYAVRGAVAVSADAVRAADLDVSFGKSRVLGKAEFRIRRTGRASHSAALRAPMLHLEDVGAARWIGGPVRIAPGEAPAAQLKEAELARVFEWLRAADVDVTVDVDALHGGAERFASGRVRASLASGRLAVELQDVKTESGRVDANVRIDASGAQPKFALRARVDGFEFGPLARTLDPATKLGGRVDFVADLAAQGPPGRLLPALSGTIDVAVFPHDLSAQALAFWGTGLLSAMLRSLDSSARSQVECAAASVEVGAGVASTSAFFVDTTRVRIVGQVDADLTTRALAGRLRPVSKQPELFTVAPTMLLGGTIEDPRVSVAPENLVLAPLRFATPLASFALDFVGAKGRLSEGRVGCREAYERARALHPAAAAPR